MTTRLDSSRNARRRTVSAAAVVFLRQCTSTRGLSAHTVRAYQSDLRDFARFLRAGVSIGDVSRETVQEYATALSERSLQPATIRRRVATLKIFFRWLEDEEWVPESVFHRL